MIHAKAKQFVLEYLKNNLKNIGLATGEKPLLDTATQLTDEVIRKEITSPLIDGNILVSEIYLDETEGNDLLFKSMGLINGEFADVIGEGELFISGQMNEQKDNTQSLTISIELELVEI